MSRISFAQRHRFDSWFWAVLLLVSLILVLVAFEPPVRARVKGVSPPASWALIIHVWSFSGWLVLLGLQAFLVSRRQIRRHRLFGLTMLPLAAVMVWSGTMVQVEGDLLRIGERPELLSFTIIPLSYIAIFAVLVVAAWIARRRPAAHKRLLLLATGSLMSGVFIRALGPILFPLLPPSPLTEFSINYGGTILFILVGVGYDLATRGRIHRVYWIAVPIMVAAMVAVMLSTRTEWLPELTRKLLTLSEPGNVRVPPIPDASRVPVLALAGVMGAYGHSPLRSMIVGSTTTAMIRRLTLPVLLFR